MEPRELALLALSALRGNRLRSFLSMLGIAIGIAALGMTGACMTKGPVGLFLAAIGALASTRDQDAPRKARASVREGKSSW